MGHVIQQVTLSNCVVYNVDGSNRNNLIVLGFLIMGSLYNME